MRFARVISAHDCPNPKVDQLVEAGELEVLQLDYRWPTVCREEQRSRDAYASGLLQQLATLHKSIYLDPALHVITNAGGSDTVGCIESLANFLCEHGSAELPITAIRGDNQLPRLEELMASQQELRDIRSGQKLHELTNPLISAHVQLGAGPIKTALEDGSRMVVTGCYDQAAPLIAVSASKGQLQWNQIDTLARLAWASQHGETIIECKDGELVHLLPSLGSSPGSASALQYSTASRDEALYQHADVGYRLSANSTDSPVAPASLQAEPATGMWRLCVEYLAEELVTFTVQLSSSLTADDESAIVQELHEQLRTALEVEIKQDLLELSTPNSPSNPTRRALRVRCSGANRKHREAILVAAKNWMARHRESLLPDGDASPAIRSGVAQFVCEVPRDMIAVSVDTRPAKEWS